MLHLDTFIERRHGRQSEEICDALTEFNESRALLTESIAFSGQSWGRLG